MGKIALRGKGYAFCSLPLYLSDGFRLNFKLGWIRKKRICHAKGSQLVGRVADHGGFDLDPNPTSEKTSDSDPDLTIRNTNRMRPSRQATLPFYFDKIGPYS